MKKTLSILLLLIMVHANAQYPKVDIPGSEIRKITSSIVPGQEYELQISLPANYKTSTKKYPVVYLMDSQWDFPLVKSIYGEQYYDGFIPEMIIVGVTWGGVNPNPDSLRARDYTPTTESRLPQSGGADKFLAVMKNELFPFMEANYKVDSKNRTLVGCSLGGLLTLYTLFTHTEMFTGYVAASPAFGWDKEILYQYEKSFYEKKSTLPARLYMTIGGVEGSVPGFEKLTQFLSNRHYPTTHIQSKVLDNTGHSGTKNETYSRGLQYVFERPMLKLDAALLNTYAGNYEMPNGNKLEIKNENNQLAIYFNSTNKYILFAADETNFYSTNEFFNMHFKMGSGSIEGFQLDRYGNTQFLKKIK
jgi:predicted alpha/beta superfamily hydrolase